MTDRLKTQLPERPPKPRRFSRPLVHELPRPRVHEDRTW